MTEEAKTSAVPEIKPCRHMDQWVNALADGSLTGFARWYTQLHVSGCHQCHAALEALQRLKARLQALRAAENASVPTALPLSRREALNAALDEVEKKRL